MRDLPIRGSKECVRGDQCDCGHIELTCMGSGSVNCRERFGNCTVWSALDPLRFNDPLLLDIFSGSLELEGDAEPSVSSSSSADSTLASLSFLLLPFLGPY